MSKHTIIFDTETTGLPLPAGAPLQKQPYVIEFYGVKVDEDFNIVAEFEHLIKPPISIPKEASRANKIYDEDVANENPFAYYYDELADFFLNTHASVAHNHAFDEKMIAFELQRLEKDHKFPWARHQICTVEKTIQIRGHRLTLTKLHNYLFNKGFGGAHRAKTDVFALVRCYHELLNRGII